MKKNQKKEVVLGNDFFIEIRDIYYEKLLIRLEQFNDTIVSDLHSAVQLLDSKNFKKEYSYSVKKCFDYLIDSSKTVLFKEHIEYIKEKQDTFLSDGSEALFLLLNDLDKKILTVLLQVSNNSLSDFVKGGLKSAASVATDVAVSLVATSLLGDFFGNIVSEFVLGSEDKDEDDKTKKKHKEQRILSDFNNTYSSVTEKFDTIWGKLCDLLYEISENTPIRFGIDKAALEKQKEEEKKIAMIIENNLVGKDSGFYFYPNIPAGKKDGAKSSYLKMDKGEQLICLYDSTVFGGAREGICLTTHAIYWKDNYGQFIGYGAIKKTKFDNDGNLIIKCEWITDRGCSYSDRRKRISKKYNGKINDNEQVVKNLKKTLDEIVAYIKSLSTDEDRKDTKKRLGCIIKGAILYLRYVIFNWLSKLGCIIIPILFLFAVCYLLFDLVKWLFNLIIDFFKSFF